jgi:hypothetical protein
MEWLGKPRRGRGDERLSEREVSSSNPDEKQIVLPPDPSTSLRFAQDDCAISLFIARKTLKIDFHIEAT